MSLNQESIETFDFDLPSENIAHQPVLPRENAALLHIKKSSSHVEQNLYQIKDLPNLLRPSDLLVFNNTRVLPAKLNAHRIRDGHTASVSITLDRPLGTGEWKALIKNSRRLKINDTLFFLSNKKTVSKPTSSNIPIEGSSYHSITARITDLSEGGGAVLSFSELGQSFTNFLHEVGVLALPPYIKREDGPSEEDEKNYQTIFSKIEGAVAAPTAGLHFTESFFQDLAQKQIEHCFVTLHVGAGTFLPIRDSIQNHVMHAEWGSIDPEVALKITHARKEGRRIIAVGTTSLRLLESATDQKGVTHPWSKETDIFIRPGHYQFKGVNGLITNFHLPKSTLFMLVCAFMGIETMQKAYAFAIEHKLRFYSYGDACFLEKDLLIE